MINENAGRRLGVDKQKVMDKVRKCLALSKSTSGNKPSFALSLSQALMAKHGLTDEHVELSQVVSATAKAGWGISAPQYMVSLVNLVERVFGVIAVFQGWGSRTHAIEYFGIGCQPEIAAYVSDVLDRKSTRLNSSHVAISYAVFCLKKKKNNAMVERLSIE